MKLTIIAALLAISPIAGAQVRALATLGAVHAEKTTHCPDGTPQDLGSFTPGAGIAYDISDSVMVAAGGWRTSQGNWAPFAITDWRPLRYESASFGIFGGGSGGYCLYENRIGAIAGFEARVDIDRAAIHLLYIPSFGSQKNVAALGLVVSLAL